MDLGAGHEPRPSIGGSTLPIDEEHARYIRAALKLGPHDEIPAYICATVADMERMAQVSAQKCYQKHSLYMAIAFAESVS